MRNPRLSNSLRKAFLILLAGIATLVMFPRAAQAVGSFKLRSTEANEVSGAWHIYVTIELPKPPLTAHQSMKFLFTKTMVYERSLVDGQSEPVINRQALQNQSPTVESLDVDFADPTGKIYKGTRFDFGLTRARGYEAGEYKVEIRTTDGTVIGSPAKLILKGDNPVVDRRSIAFNAKDKGIKKIEGYDAGSGPAHDDEPVPASNTGPSEVTPTGVATGFVPPEGMEETEEEKLKTRPKGCGCDVVGLSSTSERGFFLVFGAAIVGGAIAARRRRPTILPPR